MSNLKQTYITDGKNNYPVTLETVYYYISDHMRFLKEDFNRPKHKYSIHTTDLKNESS